MNDRILHQSAFLKKFRSSRDLPDRLFDLAIGVAEGPVNERTTGAYGWFKALEQGLLPDESSWPGHRIAKPVRNAIQQLGLLEFTALSSELAEEVCAEVLQAFARRQAGLDDELQQWVDEQAARFISEGHDPDAEQVPSRDEIAAGFDDAIDHLVDDSFVDEWQGLVRTWRQLAQAFGPIAEFLAPGRGWGLAGSLLQHVGWDEVSRLQKLVEQFSELDELAEELGRLRDSESESELGGFLESVVRTSYSSQQVRSPFVREETRGLRRSDDINTMLPSEASLLCHPTLRKLWHVRRAEHSLLSYRIDGVEKIFTPMDEDVEVEGQNENDHAGPVILLLDTSGSMAGRPEAMAKACVLQVVKRAIESDRDCLTYMFGGTGSVFAYEFTDGLDGISALIDLVTHSFGGGTDLHGPLERTLANLEDDTWRRADVLTVTDGIWSVSAEMLGRIEAARENGTEFFGLLIGTLEQPQEGMFDKIHYSDSWVSLN